MASYKQTEFHDVLDTCVRECGAKIVHARPLHRAVSHADWSDAGKRRTFLKILLKRSRSNLKRSISIRILLLSAMPSLSSSESTAIIVVAILCSCMHLLLPVKQKKYFSICAECQKRRRKFARPKPSFFHGYFWRPDSELDDRFSISAFWPPPKVVNDNHF